MATRDSLRKYIIISYDPSLDRKLSIFLYIIFDILHEGNEHQIIDSNTCLYKTRVKILIVFICIKVGAE